jgi:hypothetical protein
MAALMEGHNNQPKVGVDVGGDRGGACGVDAVPSFDHRNGRQKFIIEKHTLWPWSAAKHQIPHNNQPKTRRDNDGGIENDERLAGCAGGARFDRF